MCSLSCTPFLICNVFFRPVYRSTSSLPPVTLAASLLRECASGLCTHFLRLDRSFSRWEGYGADSVPLALSSDVAFLVRPPCLLFLEFQPCPIPPSPSFNFLHSTCHLLIIYLVTLLSFMRARNFCLFCSQLCPIT